MWAQVVIAIVMLVASAAMQAASMRKMSGLNKPEAGKLDVPTIDSNRNIKVIFGTVIDKSPAVPWAGDASTTEIKSDQGGKK
jgi:hypothetical protein